jgi:Domain of unknown function (DUF4352)
MTHLQPLRAFISAHAGAARFAAIAALVWIVVDWRSFVSLASLVVISAGLVMFGMLAVDSWRRRRLEKAQMVTRADDQHEALLRGDDQWGVFGLPPGVEHVADPAAGSADSRRAFLVASAAVVAGLLSFVVIATVPSRPAHQSPRPVAAPIFRTPTPAIRPIPHSPNQTAPQHIPAPAPVLQPQPAAPVLMGQHAVDGNVTFVVTSVERSKTITNAGLSFMQTTAQGTYLTAQLTITNNGSGLMEFIAAYQKLKIGDAVFVPDPAAAVWTLTFGTFVGPGTTVTAQLSFDVPTNTPDGGVLELHRSSNSSGAQVELRRAP